MQVLEHGEFFKKSGRDVPKRTSKMSAQPAGRDLISGSLRRLPLNNWIFSVDFLRLINTTTTLKIWQKNTPPGRRLSRLAAEIFIVCLRNPT